MSSNGFRCHARLLDSAQQRNVPAEQSVLRSPTREYQSDRGVANDTLTTPFVTAWSTSSTAPATTPEATSRSRIPVCPLTRSTHISARLPACPVPRAVEVARQAHSAGGAASLATTRAVRLITASGPSGSSHDTKWPSPLINPTATVHHRQPSTPRATSVAADSCA